MEKNTAVFWSRAIALVFGAYVLVSLSFQTGMGSGLLFVCRKIRLRDSR